MKLQNFDSGSVTRGKAGCSNFCIVTGLCQQEDGMLSRWQMKFFWRKCRPWNVCPSTGNVFRLHYTHEQLCTHPYVEDAIFILCVMHLLPGLDYRVPFAHGIFCPQRHTAQDIRGHNHNRKKNKMKQNKTSLHTLFATGICLFNYFNQVYSFLNLCQMHFLLDVCVLKHFWSTTDVLSVLQK